MNIRELVLATGNAGKAAELQSMLNTLHITVRSQREFGVPEVAETGLSFVENAIIKARHASFCTGLAALADDSGLAVDALDGAPGIYSARFAGEAADDAANNRKLLARLTGTPDPQRGARFHCVLALMRYAADPMPLICSGTWEGRILHEPAGTNGFGYDPLFWVPEHACSSAQLAADLKNRISHRARALQQLIHALKLPC